MEPVCIPAHIATGLGTVFLAAALFIVIMYSMLRNAWANEEEARRLLRRHLGTAPPAGD
jgi:hypothetical protein